MSRKSEVLATSNSFAQVGARSARSEAFDRAVGREPQAAPPSELPVNLISQNPDNPRDHLRDLEEMTQSVEEVGVVVAITVATRTAYLDERSDRGGELDADTKYVVVDGHRRLEAARRAGAQTIKVTVRDDLVATDEGLLEAAFVANFHRDNMTDLEEAHALKALVEFYGSQTKASKRLGMSQAKISQALSLLKIPPDLQADLNEGRVQVEHVRNLGKKGPEEQRAAVKERVEKSRQKATPAIPAPKPAPASESTESSDPNYHAVITGDADTSTIQTSGAEPADPAATQGTEKPQERPERAEGLPEVVTTQMIPWRRVGEVEEVLTRFMTAADLDELTDRLVAARQQR
ncbi:ParB/RepB/Spo0J family partition protein [Streptomyces sp. NPDC088348]|uniref:ParB/RepB/Spo0J family partition protein n=1 Tax=Streptomyces sp. NPDC088348 TaxID=3365853 RepID=UPI0038283506